MNIFCKIALQSMRKSRSRTIVTIIGVILSAAMVTAVATFVVSLQAYLVGSAIQKHGGWHVAFPDVGSAFVQDRLHDAETARAAYFENIGYATLNGGKNPDKPYLFIAGFGSETYDTLPIHLISGRLPENGGEILIPEHIATNGGVKFEIGEILTLEIGSRNTGSTDAPGQYVPYSLGEETLIPQSKNTYTVVGFYERPSFERYTAPGYTAITAADSAGEADSFSVYVTLANPRQVHAYAEGVRGGYESVLNDNVLRFMGLSDDTWFNTLAYSFGGILMALIMTGSILLIYNAFAISVGERTRQFGMLSSVGATAKQLRNAVLFEGVCIGTVGIPLGVLTGIGSIQIAIKLVGSVFRSMSTSAVPLTLTVSAPALGIAAAVSMVTILISAYLPARKAANAPVMESIRQTNAIKMEFDVMGTSKCTLRILGLPGMLALKNFKRNKKRYRSIVLSLVLSVVLFVAASAFGSYLKQAAAKSVVDVDYDICFSAKDMEESNLFLLYDALKTADGVYESSYQSILVYMSEVRGEDFSSRYREYAGYEKAEETVYLPLDMQFIEDSEYLRFLKELGLPAEEYTGAHAKMTAVAKTNLHSEETGQRELLDLFAGRAMELTIVPSAGSELTQNIDVTFVDTIPRDTLPRKSSAPESVVFMVVAPYSLKEAFAVPGVDEEQGLTFLTKDASQSEMQMADMLQNAGISSAYELYNIYKVLEQSRSIIFVVDVFTYGFTIMISLITIANVFNTISTNIRLRRRELAMLRSVGMAECDFNRMMRFECAFYGLKALLYGLPVSGILCWGIYKILSKSGEALSFTLPWGSIAVSIFSVFFIVFITMVYAVRKIKKENIIDALRDDMT